MGSSAEFGGGSDPGRDRGMGVIERRRVRPSYAIGVPAPRRTQSYFPKSNRRLMNSGLTLAWKFGAWRNVDGSYDGVQLRMVDAALFDKDVLACFMEFTETRNVSGQCMHVEAYTMTCDDESREGGEHACAVEEALSTLDGRNWLYDGESATEVATLFVDPTYIGTKVWAEAIVTMLERLAKANGGDSQHVCVLKAEPLELAWFDRESSNAEWDRGRGIDNKGPLLDDNSAFPAAAARRRAALQRLYARELGFTPIKGQWMAKLI